MDSANSAGQDASDSTGGASALLDGKATALWSNFRKLSMPQIRTFHMTWFAFFLCFLAWFGIAPLMKVVSAELQLTADQKNWCFIASVSITVLARIFIGWLCDRIGPRLTYTWLLVLGSLPVMGIGLAYNFESFLIFRLMIGAIGASFVITQYHTSMMFAPNVVGTANATSAGWGNMGGGVTQFVMPLVMAFFVTVIGMSESYGWRAAMVTAGVVCFLTGLAYYRFTQDTPAGNFKELRAAGKLPEKKKVKGGFSAAVKDYRVWALAVIYGACFGMELTINGKIALHFAEEFGLGLKTAGLAAASFGLMNLFARTLGGIFGDRFGIKWGLKGRVMWLFMVLFCEGLALMLFSQMTALAVAIPALILFSLFVQMAEGATFSIVPFVNKKALGPISGIVGAGGNLGAVAAGFLILFVGDLTTSLLILGGLVTLSSGIAFLVRFSPEIETEVGREMQAALEDTVQDVPAPVLEPVLS